MKAPMRQVLEIVDVEGARGGTIHVHILECEHWVTRRKPAMGAVPCIGCLVGDRLEAIGREEGRRMAEASLAEIRAARKP